MATPLIWTSPSHHDMRDLIQRNGLCMVTARRNSGYRVYLQMMLTFSVPWLSKPLSVSMKMVPVPPPKEHDAEVLAYLRAMQGDATDLEKQMANAAQKVYAGAAFVDDDHRKEFIQRVQRDIQKNPSPSVFKQTYDATTLKRRQDAVWVEVSKKLCVDDYPTLFPVAAAMNRRVTVILGPTNSGKTYRAIELLKNAKTGAYLGPLRLLALEIHERLNEEGVACDLLTGEERVQIPGAGHVASTIEMMNADVPLDTIVIDEVQMLVDSDRGWAWTQAVVGAPAEHLVLVGSPDVWDVLKGLLEHLGLPYDVVRCERLQPLKVEQQPAMVADARAGDAFVVFSRKDVFFYQEMLGKRGLSTAIIYGALGPEVRRSEARRFRDGEAKVLISTDAIGMGLNLPISRIVFTTAEKYDGTEVAPIDPSLVKQIAGRAGRYGHFDEGYVTAVESGALSYIRHCLNASTKIGKTKLAVAPTVAQLTMLSKEAGIGKVSKALTTWRSKLLVDDHQFAAASMYERIELAQEMEHDFPNLTFDDIAHYSMIPMPRGPVLKQIFFSWMGQIDRARQKKTELRVRWATPSAGYAGNDIETWEWQYHAASMYSWLSRSDVRVFPDGEDSGVARTRAANRLIELLKQRAKTLVGKREGVTGKKDSSKHSNRRY